MELEEIRLKSIFNSEAIRQAKTCGCYSCGKIFTSDEVKNFIYEFTSPHKTALCPYCGIDAVLPQSDEYDLTQELLDNLNEKYF